jgi:hypothetical protein
LSNFTPDLSLIHILTAIAPSIIRVPTFLRLLHVLNPHLMPRIAVPPPPPRDPLRTAADLHAPERRTIPAPPHETVFERYVRGHVHVRLFRCLSRWWCRREKIFGQSEFRWIHKETWVNGSTPRDDSVLGASGIAQKAESVEALKSRKNRAS